MLKIIMGVGIAFIVLVLSLFALQGSMPTERERTFLLAPEQTTTQMDLANNVEKVELFGARAPVKVTLYAPGGQVFKANELPIFSFTTEVGQRHNWKFDFLSASTGQATSTTTFRLTTLSASSSDAKSNEQRKYTGKHHRHVYSYYFFSATPAQSNMLVNVGDYTNPGTVYLHTSGSNPTFEVVLQAPPGEAFAWPASTTHFEEEHRHQPAPKGIRKQVQVRIPTDGAMREARYWLVDANGYLYYRDVGVQYAGPRVVTNVPAP